MRDKRATNVRAANGRRSDNEIRLCAYSVVCVLLEVAVVASQKPGDDCATPIVAAIPSSHQGVIDYTSPESYLPCVEIDSGGYWYQVTGQYRGLLEISVSAEFSCLAEIIDPDCETCVTWVECSNPASTFTSIDAGKILLISVHQYADWGSFSLNISQSFLNQTGCVSQFVTHMDIPNVTTTYLPNYPWSVTTACSGYRDANYYHFWGSGLMLAIFVEADFNCQVQVAYTDCTCWGHWPCTDFWSFYAQAGADAIVIVAQKNTHDYGKYTLEIAEEAPQEYEECWSPKSMTLPFTQTGVLGFTCTPHIVPCRRSQVAAHYFSFMGDGTTIEIHTGEVFHGIVELYSGECDCMAVWDPFWGAHDYSFVSTNNVKYVIGIGQYELSGDILGAYRITVQSENSFYPNDHCDTAKLLDLPIVLSGELSPNITRYESSCRSVSVAGNYYKIVVPSELTFRVISDVECYIEILDESNECLKYFKCDNNETYLVSFVPKSLRIIGVVQAYRQFYGTYTLMVTEVVRVPMHSYCENAAPVEVPYEVTNYLPVASKYQAPTTCSDDIHCATYFSFTGNGKDIDILVNGDTFDCQTELSTNCTCIGYWTCGYVQTFSTVSGQNYTVGVVQLEEVEDSDPFQDWVFFLSITQTPDPKDWKKWVIPICIIIPLLLIGAATVVTALWFRRTLHTYERGVELQIVPIVTETETGEQPVSAEGSTQ
ncbi:hypothetical protein Pelo_12817 [Pelomyxa schiedti]|nr:hypothetical protein Pelo_12817 [Pelomyxa schiedti]